MPRVLLMLTMLCLGLLMVGCQSVFSGDSPAGASEQLPIPIYYEDKVLVLTYHHIDPAELDFTISPDRFVTHLEALKKHNYNVVSMEDYRQYVTKGASLPPNAVVITFDDGYESFYRYAYPALKKMGYPATNFIVVKSTDVLNPKALPHLTWDQMREMKQNGMSFYNHTYDQHRHENTNAGGNPRAMLANPLFLVDKNRPETHEEYKARIRQDLALAEKRLDEELGDQPNLLAFPYGQYNDTVLEVGKELGIDLFFLYLQEGINDRDDTLVARVNAGQAGLSAEDLLAKLKRYHDR
ncbi:polysaccharide deacetylase family protein [Effusibacillus lacus]|uniref:NodB homology domain-containing protein n=1 Tax=Effusibacillus lacus TaxID=1348429 RepID=A0A292YS79_9BACL|nr:polysaccharide deacetylase family protein [Effusibacillus lacus]TCS73763.1 biofilm PGA synthesis lipoprotein PgaB [Effusibacillus lacus]GAX92026.1 hypothetical protein EFBL_3717 [Effusibacillus lacus]